MRKCNLRKKVLRAITNRQRKQAIKAHKLAKKLERSGSENARAKRVEDLLSKIRT